MLINFNAANRRKTVILLAIFVFLLATPSFLGSYLFYILSLLLVNIIVVVSFRFISLMGGWSFVHASVMGMGAYVTGILTVRFGLPLWVGIPSAGLATAACGVLIAIPCLRTRGVYFILATFATGEAIRQMWIRLQIPFGGLSGIPGIPTVGEVPYFYVVLGLTASSVAVMHRLEFSRLGDTIKSVASEESLAESIGIHAWRYRVVAFVIGAFFAGLAGALFAHKTGAITPGDFTFSTMLGILVATLLGGTGSVLGPMIGVFVITVIEYLGLKLLEWLPLVLGGIMITVILVLPGGLESLPERISVWRQTRQ
jgi:branched-chain amino acid transport system permease protein